MGIALSKLVKQISYMDFKLVAGEKGMSNEVRWLHMVESDTVSAFLQGGELVFTTGLGLNDKLTLEKLVKEVYNMHASGIVINIGPYIEKIDDSILAFANEHDFPVFETPWETRMAEIMHIFSFSINKAEQEKMELSVNMNNALLFPMQKELYAPFFNKRGFMSDWHYAVAVVQITGKNKKNASMLRYERICSRMDNYLQNHNYDRILAAAMENEIILVFADQACETKEAVLEAMIREVSGSLLMEEKIEAAIGSVSKSLFECKNSYEYAKKMINLQKKCILPNQRQIGRNTLNSFQQTGIYKLVMSLEDKDIVSEYMRESVEPLFEHDRMNDGDLAAVLEAYLRNNGSLKEVAEELNIHRNTVNYKIKKIEELLQCDMSDLSVRLELMLGLIIKNTL